MPQTNEDFDATEAAQNNTTEDAQAAAPARRRRGRRVVRGAGAADASVELKVEEHGPLFEEPKMKVLPTAKPKAAITAQPDHDDADEDEPKRPTRRRRTATTDDAPATTRRRSRAAADDDEDAPALRRRRGSAAHADDEDDQPAPTRRRRASAHDDDDDDRPSTRRRSRTAVDEDAPAPRRRRGRTAPAPDDDEPTALELEEREEDEARVGRRGGMTSLLFQEPVLPARLVHDDEDSDDDEDDRPRRRGRHARPEDDDQPAPTRRRRGRKREDDDEDTTSRSRSKAHADDDDEDEHESRHSRRRLNAQERRAAAEVEQIEEDLVLDDITYAPIDDAIARAAAKRTSVHDDDEEDDGQQLRTRRRRRSRKSEGERENAQDARGKHEHDDEEDEETTVTRRRRRRRGGKGSEEESSAAKVNRSRKQQYIDEITDVEGSTRLEAKKQRRRDNRRERSRQNQLLEQDFLARRENVDRLMVVRQRDRHTQISVLEDNVLVEHYVSDIQEVATVGNIYLGRVQNVLPSMEAAFVDIGQARNGVLYAGEVNWDSTRLEGQPRRIELAFKSGDPVLVQVTKDPIGHKGARLTSQVTLAGRFLVLVPSGGMTGVSRKLSSRERSRLKGIVGKIAPKDMGVIIRTAAEGASEEAITKDLEALVKQWEQIQSKFEEFRNGKRPKLLQGEPDMAIRVVRDIFNDDFRKMIVEGDGVYQRIEEYLEHMAPDLRGKLEKWDPAEHEGKDVFDKWQIDSQLRKGMERQVYLPSGGSIVIDRTEAMTTIDVNTGRFIGKGKSLEETVTRCNLEASEEIARQLRLRDIGGMVMIDYVDMVMPANRDLVLRRLVECLARDRTKHQVAEVTSLGLVQMTRKRIGQGLVEAFSEECPTCKGRGFIVHDEPTISRDFDDPYALKGGDPFIKTNKHGHGTEVHAVKNAPKGSSAAVKAKLAQIAAAAVAANNAETEAEDALKQAEDLEVQIEHIEETQTPEEVQAPEIEVTEVKDQEPESESETVEVTETEAADTTE
ncbi:Rne/Rng family ribonuclease [Bifidobacterium cuniculi]|uniref:Rne/Rng family ribonuclease n=1 Tax=Bifidobacterium cuniculi TaxID=1688 RepID=UPI000A41670B|nr:Rne/Rng family ribonuclease [Bifidobacterium cuniculi]